VGEFRWWGPHEDNERGARRLLVGASAIAALVALGYAGAVLVVVAFGAESRPTDRISAAGWWCIAAGGLLAFAALSLAFARTGQRRWTGFTLGLLDTQPPESTATTELVAAARHAAATLDTTAVGLGNRPPRLWIIDDPAPNALVVGHADDGHVCLTRGALALPRAELDALCAHSSIRLARPDVSLASAATAVLLAVDRVVRWTWFLVPIALFTVVLGVPASIAGALIAGMFVLLLVAIPLLALGARLAVRLLDRAGALADLDTVELTKQPRALAELLVHIVEDEQRVETSWQVGHLWFERDGVFSNSTSTLGPDLGPMASRFGLTARRPLLARAAVAVDLANGDRRLRTRLARLQNAAVR
jgi:Zn-dependent protease with chaperone function